MRVLVLFVTSSDVGGLYAEPDFQDTNFVTSLVLAILSVMISELSSMICHHDYDYTQLLSEMGILFTDALCYSDS